MPPQQPPPQEYARVVLILVLLFFLYTSPDQGPPPGFGTPHDYASERIGRARHALDVLNVTKWQDFSPKGPEKAKYEASRYLNLTGFREEDDFAWERLDAFKKRSEEFSEEVRVKGVWHEASGFVGEVYENVTGIVVGKWVRRTADLNGEPRKRVMNLTETSPGIEWSYKEEEYWTRNITGDEGRMKLVLDEKSVEELDMSLHPLSTTGQTSFSVDLVREAAATLTIQDESSSGDGWDMRVHGVHWPRQGVMIMTTTSEKFSGIFGLPHLTSSHGQFLTSQKLLNMTLEKKVEDMETAAWGDLGNPWTASPDSQGDATMPTPHCEFVVYVQAYPLKVDRTSIAGKMDPASIVHQIEEEIRFPNGAPIPEIPKMQMSAVIFSPDCGFLLESKGPPSFAPESGQHLIGVKQEVLFSSVQKWLHSFAAVIFAQILLLKMQMKEASTPSTVGRVSLYTVAFMLMGDAILFASMSLLSSTLPDLFPSALLACFSAAISVGMGVRFVGVIYNTQEPERREAMRAQEAAEAASRPNLTRPVAPIITAAGADVSARPATISSSNVPIIVPSDQDVDAEIAENATATPATILPTTNTPAVTQPRPSSSSFGALYVRFVLTMTFILFLSLSAMSWSVSFRNAYINLVAIIYLSFWIPQIRRNVIRNCRKALLWKFIIGQSVLRLLPFAYFYLKEDNILFTETDWKSFCVLAGWVWLQIWILVAQEVLGPRWGLPKSWTEEGWDYHPILREDNVEAGGLPIGLVQIPASPSLERSRTSEDMGSRKKKDGGVRTVDCAICMQVLEVPVVASGEDASSTSTAGGVVGMLARRQYMVTPCRHVFHSTCLEGWMRFRLQCPICRENLPPL